MLIRSPHPDYLIAVDFIQPVSGLGLAVFGRWWLGFGLGFAWTGFADQAFVAFAVSILLPIAELHMR